MVYLIGRYVTLAVICIGWLCLVLAGEWYNKNINGGDHDDARG